jgi:hypothetical protein
VNLKQAAVATVVATSVPVGVTAYEASNPYDTIVLYQEPLEPGEPDGDGCKDIDVRAGEACLCTGDPPVCENVMPPEGVLPAAEHMELNLEIER